MKRLLAVSFASLAIAGIVLAQDSIPDKDLGLSQTSVFDTPEPEPFRYDGSAAEITPMSHLDAPVIPHRIRDYEKITTSDNRCLFCHLQPEAIGKPVAEHEVPPLPASHYLDEKDEEGLPKLAGGRWVCTQCHVAQADTEPLVPNSSAR